MITDREEPYWRYLRRGLVRMGCILVMMAGTFALMAYLYPRWLTLTQLMVAAPLPAPKAITATATCP